MAMSNLTYDNCEFKHHIAESVGTLSWVLDPCRYNNNRKCRMEFGILGGTAASHINGNLVDLESDLFGITRLAGKCSEYKYQNPCPKGDMATCQPQQIIIRDSPTTRGRIIDTRPQHLRSCQMINYNPIPLPPAYGYSKCR
jgi:hypothetical protein